MGFPGGSVVKNPPANAGDMGLIPGLGRSPREGNGNPLQYSCLENPIDKGAWWATVHGVAKELDIDVRAIRIELADRKGVEFARAHCLLSRGDLVYLEKEMATHSSILAWKIPLTKEPSVLPSMGLQGVGSD